MDYCPICLRTFGRITEAHRNRAYYITPLGRLVLRGLRAEKRAA